MFAISERNAVRDSLTATFKAEWCAINPLPNKAQAARATVVQAVGVLRELGPAASAALVTAPTLATAAR